MGMMMGPEAVNQSIRSMQLVCKLHARSGTEQNSAWHGMASFGVTARPSMLMYVRRGLG